jgi:HK97 family phage portal protein
MSWFNRIRTYPWSKTPDQILAAGPAAAGVIAVGNVGKPTWPAHDIGTYEREGYIALALIFSCVNLIADAASAVPLRVFDERPDGSTPTLPKHGMATLMRRPNPEQSQADFIWSVIATAAIAGFCVIEKVRSAGGRVVELWPLDPTRCRAVPRDQAPPDWQYSVPGQRDPIKLKAEDVIVRRWRKRMSRSPYGIGPLEALLREVGLANCMTDFLKAFFDGGAIAQQAIILQTRPGAQKLPQAEKDAFVEEWTRANAGLRNAARPLFFGGIKEIVSVGFDFNELAWVGLRDLNDLAICQAFGVPASMAQIRAGLEHSDSRANAEVDKAKLYENTVIPQLTGFDGDLTLGLLTDFEPDPSSMVSIEFDVSGIKALQENRNERATALTPAFSAAVSPRRCSAKRPVSNRPTSTSISAPFRST